MLALLLALAAGASPSVARASVAPTLTLADGRVVRLPLRLELASLDGGSGSPPALAWRMVAGALVGTAADGRVSATVRLAPGEGAGLVLEVTLRYLASVEVDREAVRFRLAGPAQVLGRNLSLARLATPLRVDRGTPVLVATPDLVVVGGPGIPAARYAPAPGGAVDVLLILDDLGAHPFSVYDKCLDRLPGLDQAAPVQFAALEKKLQMGRVARRAGEVVSGQAAFYPPATGWGILPLVVERWADGAQGAVVFTDHADRTDPEALRALLYGDSRPVCARTGRGFLGHGLKITKSFFLHARRGGLDDPETARLALDLLGAGSEVASHSISGEADDREAVRAGLAALARFRVETWIDHEPYTNCEAISSQGWRSEGPYGIRDLLVFAGFHWLWEAGDVAGFASEPRLVDLFAAVDPGSPDPPIYPLPMDPRLWVFQSSMFYGSPERMAAALSDDALRRLESRRGLFVGHTYLSASARTTSRAEHLAKLTVRETPEGHLDLDRDFDAALGRIAEHVRAGALASLTWAEAGGRLRALEELEVVYLPDGTALVENRGAQPLFGLTVAVPAGGIDLIVEGATPKGRDLADGRSRLWFDLPAGSRAAIRAARDEQTVPLLAAERATLELR